MTQEEKQELLVAMCGYLPYGLKVDVCINPNICSIDLVRFDNFGTYTRLIEEGEYSVKPYLRSIKSMTLEEQKEFVQFHCVKLCPIIMDCCLTIENEDKMFRWLNSHFFDYRRDKDGKTMIERGLALEATANMY